MITHADKDIDDLATASQWIPNLYDEAAIQTAKTSYIFELIRNKKPVMFMSSGAQPGCWHHLHWDESGYCEEHRQTVLQPHHLLQEIQVSETDLWPFNDIPQWNPLWPLFCVVRFVAESEQQREQWVEALQACVSHSLSSNAVAQKIWSEEANQRCADCGAPQPDWASVNLCVVLCKCCAGTEPFPEVGPASETNGSRLKSFD